MRRVKRPAEHEALLKNLAGDDGPFATLAEVLAFAAGLGFAEGRRDPLQSTGEQIDYDVFQRLGVEGLIDMLAATTVDDVGILGEDQAEQRLEIFEEYANGGLNLLQARMSPSGRYLEEVLGIILEREDISGVAGPDSAVDFDSVVDELTR